MIIMILEVMDRSQYSLMLKTLDDKLSSEDLVVLKFLCQDLIKTSKLDNIKWHLDLFEALGLLYKFIRDMKMIGI